MNQNVRISYSLKLYTCYNLTSSICLSCSTLWCSMILACLSKYKMHTFVNETCMQLSSLKITSKPTSLWLNSGKLRSLFKASWVSNRVIHAMVLLHGLGPARSLVSSQFRDTLQIWWSNMQLVQSRINISLFPYKVKTFCFGSIFHIFF